MYQEWKICIWTPGVHGPFRTAPSGQPQSSSNPKILLVKVVWYESLMIKIPIIGGLTNCLASGELLSEATATSRCQRNTGRGKAELRIINSKATVLVPSSCVRAGTS